MRFANRFCASLLPLGMICALAGLVGAQENSPTPFDAQRPNRNRPGPWDNDVVVYHSGAGTKVEKVAVFSRAGVPTLARLKNGRIAAAFQHFPEDDTRNFDRVAVCFSIDEGRNWTVPAPIVVNGLEPGLARPFDPTLVPLPDGRVRLYFTSNRSPDFRNSTPAIYSAISTNAIEFTFEPGVRFGLEGRIVIDSAVALHKGVFHLFAPDNGTAASFMAHQDGGQPSPGGIGYHATSQDGLNFTRQPDVQLDDSFRWLGNAQSEGDGIRFFGTGGPVGIWSATSTNGQTWTVDEDFPPVLGADPAAVKLSEGSWLVAATSPLRQVRQQFVPVRPGTPGQRVPLSPLMNALDANGDGVIDEWELQNASALLRKLDRNGDGRLTPEELRPPGNAPRNADQLVPRRPRPLDAE